MDRGQELQDSDVVIVKNNKQPANWNDARIDVLLECFLDQIGLGNFTDNRFKGQSWTAIQNDFNRRNQLSLSKGQLQSKYSGLKTKIDNIYYFF